MAININQTTQAQAVLSTSQLLTLIQQSAKYLFQQLFELLSMVQLRCYIDLSSCVTCVAALLAGIERWVRKVSYRCSLMTEYAKLNSIWPSLGVRYHWTANFTASQFGIYQNIKVSFHSHLV